MKVGDFSSDPVVAISPEAPVGEALERMRQKEIHHLVVLAGDKVVGIVSDRDIFTKAFDRETFKVNSKLPVGNVMVADVPVVDENTGVRQALLGMRQRDLSALPVCKAGAVGILTETDFLNLLSAALERGVETNADPTGAEVRVGTAFANPLLQRVMKLLSDIGI